MLLDHMKLKGEWSSRRIWLDGKELFPGPSQKLYNHSPDGFCWGYYGSGPAQLALALLLEITKNENFSLQHHQDFKLDFIARFYQKDFEFDGMIMVDWIEERKGF